MTKFLDLKKINERYREQIDVFLILEYNEQKC